MPAKYSYDRNRPSARNRGYDSKWQRESRQYLAAHRRCAITGCDEPAKHVDHIEPHGGDQRLFWRRSNWQPLCHSHHTTKTNAVRWGRAMVVKGSDAAGMPLDPDHHWNKQAPGNAG